MDEYKKKNAEECIAIKKHFYDGFPLEEDYVISRCAEQLQSCVRSGQNGEEDIPY